MLSPDVIVTKNKKDWSVELNNSTIPKITVYQEYVNEIERPLQMNLKMIMKIDGIQTLFKHTKIKILTMTPLTLVQS